jgi:hypothetical protein
VAVELCCQCVVVIDSRAELVNRLQQLLVDPVLRDQLGASALARSAELSWQQETDAMRAVLESVVAGHRIVGWSDQTPCLGVIQCKCLGTIVQ